MIGIKVTIYRKFSLFCSVLCFNSMTLSNILLLQFTSLHFLSFTRYFIQNHGATFPVVLCSSYFSLLFVISV